MDMNLMMKRGKIKGKNLGNLVFHHHHRGSSRGYGFTLQEYEFSCTNSPNPVFFHAKRRHHNYFSCLNAVVEEAPDETPRPAFVVPRIEYTPSPSPSPQCFALSQELASGENKSPLRSPFSVRISNFSEDDAGESPSGEEVDDEAEQFIKRFYEQLRTQSRIALIQYQEMEVQEMLARGR